ncbi:lamin tail domain-containing protein [Streptomyces sp. NBC_00448]|uniref:lamin tail domain-containing protein n=1 Tax=Streptomyces sp. NBC_00448 TaxID=2903652 RepID=UPI002E1D5AA0
MSRIATRMTAAAIGAGALLAAAALPAVAADGRQHLPAHHPQRSAVVLGAVHHDSAGRDTHSARALDTEWVTVDNTGRNAVNLNGWTLSASDHHVYRFSHLTLAGHKSVRVHTGAGRNTTRDVYQNSRTLVWAHATETATLRDSRGHLVASKSWGKRDEHRGGRAGDHRAGDNRNGDHRAGDHRTGDHRTGDRHTGDHRNDHR